MKKSIVLLVSALCLLVLIMSSMKAKADTLKLVSASAQSGGEYIYPYGFSINGAATTTGLMCVDLNRIVTFGETWNVSEQSVTISTSFEEEAFIFSQLGKGTYSDSNIQWAAWSIIDSADVHARGMDTSNVTGLLAAAQNAVTTPGMLTLGFYSNYVLYVPTSDQTGWTAGIPQEFIGTSPVPEPSSLMLLGTGLMSVAGLMRHRMRRV